MPTEIVIPKLGESVVEGTVSKWLLSEGDSVQQFDPIVGVTTDKVDTEIPASASSTVLKLLIPNGTTVQAGTLLGWIGEVGEELPETDTTTARPDQPRTATLPAAASPAPSKKNGGFVSPVVARLAAEHEVNLDQVKGTGHGGHITKKDIKRFITESVAANTRCRHATVDAYASGHLRAHGTQQMHFASYHHCVRSGHECGGRPSPGAEISIGQMMAAN